MPTLAERRAQQAANPGGGANGDFIKFKSEGETRILRFLFTDASTLESKLRYPMVQDAATGKWAEDPNGKGSYRVMLNCVEYNSDGKGARRVRLELSEYLYNEYLAPYIEKDVPASKNVWEVKVRRPGSMDVSYVAFKIEGATELTFPIPEATANQSSAPATPAYVAPVAPVVKAAPVSVPVTPAPATSPAVSAVQPTTAATCAPEPKKSKYF